ncbi:MAG TPA: Gfo/Idh/MocA family oxidoreductase [Polyangiaceae bacterium]|nr:Gfo/Idh/MocA family oxidoreductase [Polyangiaceae bacterium]
MARVPIGVGLVGWGLAGRALHAPFIKVTPELELVAAVTSREIDAAVFPSTKRVDSLDDLLDIEGIDLVVIATPNRLHVEQSLRALACGKHVVCDKPLAETAAEVRTLMAAAAAADRLLVPYQNRRWDGDFRTLKALLASGQLGKVHYYESRWSKYQPVPRERVAWKAEPRFGGPLYDLFPHLIDQAIVLFGRPSRVFARIDQNRPTGTVHDRAAVVLEYDDGPEVVLEVDLLDAFGGRKWQVRGLLGSFEKRGFDPQEARLVAGELPNAADWGREGAESYGMLRRATGPGEPVVTAAGDHRLFYHGIVDAIVHHAPPPVTLDDVLCQTEIIEAASRSNATRQVVALGPPLPEK